MAVVTIPELVKVVGIPEEKLNAECSEDHRLSVSSFLDWRQAAPHLGLSEREIDDIEVEGKTEQEKRRKSLKMWRGKHGFKATYKKLVGALLASSQADDAEKVCRLLVKGESFQSPMAESKHPLRKSVLENHPLDQEMEPLGTGRKRRRVTFAADPPSTLGSSEAETVREGSSGESDKTITSLCSGGMNAMVKEEVGAGGDGTPDEGGNKRRRLSQNTDPMETAKCDSPQEKDVHVALLSTSSIAESGLEVSKCPTAALDCAEAAQKSNLEDEIRELERLFGGLVDKAARMESIDLFSLKLCIAQLPVSLKYPHLKLLAGKLSDIRKAESVLEVFFILAEYWDFLNCGLLDHIIDKFGSQDIKDQMAKYQEKLKDFRSRTTLRDYIGKWTHRVTHYFSEVKMEVTEEWLDRTLEDIEQLRRELSRQSSLKGYTFRFNTVEPGSVFLMWALHSSFPLRSLVLLCTKELCNKYGIMKIMFKGICIFDQDGQETSALVQEAGTKQPPAKQAQLKRCIEISSHQPENLPQLENQPPKMVSKPEKPPATAQMDQQETAKGVLEQDTRKAELQAKELEQKVQTMAEQLSTLQVERKDLLAALDQREAQLSYESKEKEYLEERVKQLQQRMEEQEKEAVKEKEHSQQQAKELEQKVQVMVEQLSTLQAERKDLLAALAQREAQLSYERKEKEYLEQRVKQLQQTEELDQQLQEKEKGKGKAQQTVEKLEQQLKEVKGKEHEMEEQKRQSEMKVHSEDSTRKEERMMVPGALHPPSPSTPTESIESTVKPGLGGSSSFQTGLSDADSRVLETLTQQLRAFCLTAEILKPGISASAKLAMPPVPKSRSSTLSFSSSTALQPTSMDEFSVITLSDQNLGPKDKPSDKTPAASVSSQSVHTLIPEASQLITALQRNMSTLETLVKNPDTGGSSSALVKIARPHEYGAGDVVLLHPIRLAQSKSLAFMVMHLERPKPYILLDPSSYSNFGIHPDRMPDLFLAQLTEKPRSFRFENDDIMAKHLNEKFGEFFRVKAERANTKFQPAPVSRSPSGTAAHGRKEEQKATMVTQELREFRYLVVEFSHQLIDIEREAIIYVRLHPLQRKYKSATNLEVLSKLEEDGVFSVTSPEGLIEIAEDINRYDLVHIVEEFLEKYKKHGSRSEHKAATDDPESKEELQPKATMQALEPYAKFIVFRRLVFHFSQHLSRDDQMAIMYIRGLSSQYRNATALEVLSKLEEDGVFSVTSPEGLIKIAEDINRYDLVHIVEEFLEKYKKHGSRSEHKAATDDPESKEELQPKATMQALEPYAKFIVFRRLVFHFSQHLSRDDQMAIMYIRGLSSQYRNATALEVLSKLEEQGVFSVTSPEGLIKIAEDINRYDLVPIVEEFYKEGPQFKVRRNSI